MTGLINNWKVRKLERRIGKWKREGDRLLTELVKNNIQAVALSKYCVEALDEFLIKPKGEPKK